LCEIGRGGTYEEAALAEEVMLIVIDPVVLPEADDIVVLVEETVSFSVTEKLCELA